MKIEICGGIASGKTTLCRMLKNLGFSTCYEDFQSNPFYNVFYTNPQLHAFETELTFLLQHYSAIKTHSMTSLRVTDFSLVLDMAYADVTLAGERHTLFTSLHDNLRKEIGFPDLLIHIHCPVHILLERIRLRNRDAEQSISGEYLSQINNALQRQVQNYSERGTGKVFSVDSSQVDFRVSLEQMPELEVVIGRHTPRMTPQS